MSDFQLQLLAGSFDFVPPSPALVDQHAADITARLPQSTPVPALLEADVVWSPDHVGLCVNIVDMFRQLNLVDWLSGQLQRNCEPELIRLVSAISLSYLPVPFHNFRHAYTVTHTTFCFLARGVSLLTDAAKPFTDLERCGMMMAALCHDLHHPGLSNGFQAAAKTVLFERHKQSTLEQHHLACANTLLFGPHDYSLLAHLPADVKPELIRVLSACILATDMFFHANAVKVFVNIIELKDAGREVSDDVVAQMVPLMTAPGLCTSTDPELVLHSVEAVMLVKLADICNEGRPWETSRRWADALAAEFGAQVALERARSLPVTAFMVVDTLEAQVKSQLGFIDHVILPLLACLRRTRPTMEPLASCDATVRSNRQRWAELSPASSQQ